MKKTNRRIINVTGLILCVTILITTCQTVSNCSDDEYGSKCENRCSANCATATGPGRVCDGVSGACLRGCQPGYRGIQCIEICKNGTYGLDCAERCSATCTANTCDPISGVCEAGCQAGYEGPRCRTSERDRVTCADKRYGRKCEKSCHAHCAGRNRAGRVCDVLTGVCLRGCTPGHQGNHCDIFCSPGTYGMNCTKKCSATCRAYTCDAISGVCDVGCQAGYEGPSCRTMCRVGTYGEDCASTCSDHCAVRGFCESVSGTCYKGCQAGYFGPTCQQGCPRKKNQLSTTNGKSQIFCTRTFDEMRIEINGLPRDLRSEIDRAKELRNEIDRERGRKI
ncbi:hypothetical protein RRG08_026342 [Elysia crispata]|uniref:EGF-like domain-containing protein n=1 Tax=Elysia crispata TaxID=231223 RepID=A0AAE1CJ10_9GAST|nr:hypothetical protein RRG08_026342 [Elysia crispata]